jgi:hypothetical protein
MTVIGWPATARFYSAEEQSIIRLCERAGQTMTPERINLILAQATEFGDLDPRPGVCLAERLRQSGQSREQDKVSRLRRRGRSMILANGPDKPRREGRKEDRPA